MELRKHYERAVCGTTLCCDVIQMGKDYAVCLWDEKGGHIGSVCMSVARPSLTGNGISATTSVLNCIGHKEESIARSFSEAVAIRNNCTAVCSCGIHLDGITPEMISEIQEACEEIKKQIIC
ncbi:MAG: hypothetical protein LUF29_09930 [Oscillospiraceae bacterium]|nr:hypothetical protein [Oscillospiraceae bacterium]